MVWNSEERMFSKPNISKMILECPLNCIHHLSFPFQSVSAAIAFFYSNYLFLQWQLLIMVIVGFFGTISFFTVEWAAPAFVAKNTEYSSI